MNDNIRVTDLRCEYKLNSVGIDTASPRLSWQLIGMADNILQAGFRIQLALSVELLGKSNAFDSGICRSADPWCFLPGADLKAECEYWWRVGIKLKRSPAVIWSQPACFITGLRGTPWSAEWIYGIAGQGCSLFRREITLQKPIVRALFYTTALGIYDVRINGDAVDESTFLPGWTDYRKRVYYTVHEISGKLLPERNVLAAELAPGWFSGFIGPFQEKRYYGDKPYFSCRLRLDYQDGTTEIINSDVSWLCALSPTVHSDLLMGEDYDARLEFSGWDSVELASYVGWCPVKTLRDEALRPAAMENYPGSPPRPIMSLSAIGMHRTDSGEYIFDLGQNMVGVVKLRLWDVEAGTKITLRHGEMLNQNGTLHTENLRAAKATDSYIAKGESQEVWNAKFTFHGFRYVELTGLHMCPRLDSVVGIVITSATTPSGSFECGIEEVNRLFNNIVWGQRGNYFDIPTDCPQRDERLGWTGDVQIFARSAVYLADVATFFRKWLADLNDAQMANGKYPTTAPFLGRPSRGNAAWSDAGIICPYELWMAYGDINFIKPYWSQMQRYMDYIHSENNEHNGAEAISYGDWLCIGAGTSPEIIGLAYRAYDAQLMQEMAQALGYHEDVEKYTAMTLQDRELFLSSFFSPSGDLLHPTQTACALAICKNLVGGEQLDKTAECLVNEIKRNNFHLSTGFVGIKYLCPALTLIGRHDLAVSLLLNTDYPSWLYEVKNGATTIWERWNGWTAEDGFADSRMNSFNHYVFGSVCEWLFRSLGGIVPLSPGFRRTLIAPRPDCRLKYVRIGYDTPLGRVASAWEYHERKVVFDITIPGGMTATIKMPGAIHDIRIIEASQDICENEYYDESICGNGRYVFELNLEKGEDNFESKIKIHDSNVMVLSK